MKRTAFAVCLAAGIPIVSATGCRGLDTSSLRASAEEGGGPIFDGGTAAREGDARDEALVPNPAAERPHGVLSVYQAPLEYHSPSDTAWPIGHELRVDFSPEGVVDAYGQPGRCVPEYGDPDCQVRRCYTDWPWVPPPNANAGTVRFLSEVRYFDFDYREGGYGLAWASDGPFWNADGMLVTFSATGGDVPAFETQLNPPFQVTVTAPLPPDGGALQIKSGSWLNLFWTSPKTPHGYMDFRIEQDLTFWSRELTCRFPLDDGRGSVKDVPMGLLKAGAITRIQAVAGVDKTLGVGGWRVLVTARQHALDPSGGTYKYSMAVPPP